MNDTRRKQLSVEWTQAQHDSGHLPHIIKDCVGYTYAGAFAIWSVLKDGKWTACSRKPKTKETRTTMELE